MKKSIIVVLTLFTISLLSCEEDPEVSYSNPSLAPAISFVYPELGQIGDEIIITGENFGKLIEENYVTFEATGSEIIRFDSWAGVITVRVPATLTPGDYNIFLSVNGNTVGAKKTFRVMDPIVK